MTKKEKITQLYTSQRRNSSLRGHGKPQYSIKELREWMLSQDLFHSLFKTWEENNFSRRLAPSIDRINPDIGYCFSNIQLMTWGDNFKKSLSEKSNARD